MALLSLAWPDLQNEGEHEGGEVVQMTILLLSSFATTGKFSIPCPLVSSHQDGDDKRFCLSTVSWAKLDDTVKAHSPETDAVSSLNKH